MTNENRGIDEKELWENLFPEVDINKDKKNRDIKDKSKPRTILLTGAGFTERYDKNWSRSALWWRAWCHAKHNNGYKETYKLMDDDLGAGSQLNFEKFITDQPEEYCDIESLKNVFLHAMLEACEIQPCPDQKDRIGKFLMRFDQVFTTNYDPLIYRSIISVKNNREYEFCFGDFFNKRNLYEPGESEFEIGFRKRDQTQISYLHGAFFLTMNDTDKLEKIKQSPDGQQAMMGIAKNKYIEGKQKPLIVTDNTSKEKLTHINNNVYLQDRYSTFENYRVESEKLDKDKQQLVSINLCIIGYDATPQDKHITDAIARMQPNKVVICTHRKKYSNNIKDMIALLKKHSDVKTFCIKDKEDKMLPCD